MTPTTRRYFLDCFSGSLQTAYIGRMQAYDSPQAALVAMVDRQQECDPATGKAWDTVRLTPVDVPTAHLIARNPRLQDRRYVY